MKLLYPGGYTWENKGDAALVMAMEDEMARVFPGAETTLLTDTPELDRMYYRSRVLGPLYGDTLENKDGAVSFHRWLEINVLWRLPAWCGTLANRLLANRSGRTYRSEVLRLYGFLAYTWLAAALLGKGCSRAYPGGRREVVQAFCEADAVVFVPGGYILSPHPEHTHWYRQVAAAFLAKWLKKPLYCFAWSVGPFRGEHHRWLAGRLLRCADLVILREPLSAQLVRELAPRAKAIVTTDAAFLLRDCPPGKKQELRERYLRPEGLIVGISIRHYDFPGAEDVGREKENYAQAMAGLADHLIEKHGAHVYFVPQVLADAMNDLEFTDMVVKRINAAGGFTVIRDNLDPLSLKGLYANFAAFVGVRMHANIFALSEGVPTVAIAYEPKTAGIMTFLGLTEYFLDIKGLSLSDLCARVDSALAQRAALAERIRQAVARARQTSRCSADAIAEDYRRKNGK